MTKPSVIDLFELLAPISDEAPAGSDPRENVSPTSPYFRVKDARSAARAAERVNLDPDSPPAEAWSTVLNAGEALLRKDAKDLEIAAWVTEALVRLEGFAGLRDGLRLITGLTEAFWGHLYPMPDEDGIETRVAPVTGLNGSGAPGTLAQSIRTLPLVGITRPFSIWSYDQALETDKLTDPVRKQARLAAGTPSMDMFRDSLAETASSELFETLTTVEECLAAISAMAASLDAVAGYDAPPTGSLRELLEHIASAIRYFGGDKLATFQARSVKSAEVLATDASAPPAAAASSQAPAGTSSTGALGGTFFPHPPGSYPTRDHALAAIQEIAAYFRRTEPQAPISYTLEEAVRRAQLPLPDLLRELTLDASNISRFLLAAGIKLDGGPIDIVLPPPSATVAPIQPQPTPSAKVEAPATEPAVPSSDGW